MWHHPDRVLRQFGMEQPIPRTEMTEAEVTRLLGLTLSLPPAAPPMFDPP
ncbi:hypothetical protein LINGRAPRIM_LOCUS3140 [Linum grandiflorum]